MSTFLLKNEIGATRKKISFDFYFQLDFFGLFN